MMTLVPDPKANYKNLFQAFSRIITQERPKALFRGIGVVATGAGPAHALYFSCYEFAKKGLTKNGQQSSVLAQGESRKVDLYTMYMLRTDYQPGRFINWPPIYKPVNRFINGLTRLSTRAAGL